MNKESLVNQLRSIPDFPVPGVLFRDVTTLFQNPGSLREMLDDIYELYKDKGITKVAGIESRGFILGSALAVRLGAGFVPVRKPGKLPWDTYSATYMKEYGPDSIEVHSDALIPGDVVLIHDDLLATGGTTAAAIELMRKFSPKRIYANFIIELAEFPETRAKLPADVEVTALLKL